MHILIVEANEASARNYQERLLKKHGGVGRVTFKHATSQLDARQYLASPQGRSVTTVCIGGACVDPLNAKQILHKPA